VNVKGIGTVPVMRHPTLGGYVVFNKEDIFDNKRFFVCNYYTSNSDDSTIRNRININYNDGFIKQVENKECHYNSGGNVNAG